jgi:hypothetical protein
MEQTLLSENLRNKRRFSDTNSAAAPSRRTAVAFPRRLVQVARNLAPHEPANIFPHEEMNIAGKFLVFD